MKKREARVKFETRDERVENETVDDCSIEQGEYRQKKRVIAYLHTHWDREWYREKEEFNLRLLEVFDEILEELKNEAAPCFYFDGQTGALIDYLKFRPQKRDEIVDLIKKKKLFTGPFFVSADAFLQNARCLVKNLEYGISYSKSLGGDDFIGYMCDIFAHSRGVFKILKCFGIKNAIIWRGTGAINSEFLAGGIKTTRLVYGYFHDILHKNMPPEIMALELEKTLDKIARYSGNVLLLPLGADHLAIAKNSLDKIRQVNKYLKNYEIELSCPQKYFSKADFKNCKEYDGEFLDNSENYILGGVYSSRIYQKIKNAKLMHKITRIVEPLDLFFGSKYRANIDYAWELLLKNHAHDSIYGCSTDLVHRAVDARFDKISSILEGIEKRIIRDCSTDCSNAQKTAVINLSNFKCKGIVKIVSENKFKNAQIIAKHRGFCDKKLYNIREIPVTEDITTIYEQLVEVQEIDPFTFCVVEPKVPKKLTSAHDNAIENPFLRLELKNGEIIVTDKVSGKIYSNFIKILDTKDLGDSYNYAPADKGKTVAAPKSKVIEDGQIQSKLRIYFKNIELDVILNNKSRFFEFNLKIKNKQKNHKLQFVFNLKQPVNTVFAQDSLGIIKRTCDPDYSLFDNEPAVRPYELKTNSYPMQNFVYAQGTGILSEGLYEYEIYKNELRIALLRATGIISNPKNPARAVPAGPPIKTPELQCQGIYNLRLGLCFCPDANELFEASEEFLGTNIGFCTNLQKQNKALLKVPENHLIYGFCTDGRAILYERKKERIIFKRLANKAKVI